MAIIAPPTSLIPFVMVSNVFPQSTFVKKSPIFSIVDVILSPMVCQSALAAHSAAAVIIEPITSTTVCKTCAATVPSVSQSIPSNACEMDEQAAVTLSESPVPASFSNPVLILSTTP